MAGLLLGPFLGLVAIGHSLEMIAELGIVLLLFLVGLELSFDKIKDLGKAALTLSCFQVCFTALGGFAVAKLLGFALLPAIFLAATVTFSSTVVVIKLLDQKGHMHRRYARLAVGLFLEQDIIIILALTVLSGLGSGTDFELASVLKSLGIAFEGWVYSPGRGTHSGTRPFTAPLCLGYQIRRTPSSFGHSAGVS